MFKSVKKSNLPPYGKIITYNCAYLKSATLKDKKTFIEFIFKHVTNEHHGKYITTTKLRKNSINSGVRISHNIIKIPYNKNDYRCFAYKGSIDDDCGTYGIIEKDVIVFDEKGNIYSKKMGLKIIKCEFMNQKQIMKKQLDCHINEVIREAKFNAKSCKENLFTPVFKITKNSVTAYYPIILFTMNLFQYVIYNREKLPFVYLVKILSQIAHIIQTNISANNIVHADIKTNNIFVRANKINPMKLDIKIGDFGLAREHEKGKTYGAFPPFGYSLKPGSKIAHKLDDAFAFGIMNYHLCALWLGPHGEKICRKINQIFDTHIQYYTDYVSLFKPKPTFFEKEIKRPFDECIENLRENLLKKTGINENIFNEYWAILEQLTIIVERNKRMPLNKAHLKLTEWLKKAPAISTISFQKIAELNKNMRQNLTTAGYYYGKGQLFWESHHKNSTALACYAKAVAINPKHIHAFISMAKINTKLEKYTISCENFNKAIKALENNPIEYAKTISDIYFNIAKINTKLKKYTISRKNLDKAIAALADNPIKYAKKISDIYFEKACVYFLEENGNFAIGNCELAIKYNSNNKEAGQLLQELIAKL